MYGGGEKSCGVTRTGWHSRTCLLVALASTWPVISRQCWGVSFLLCTILDVKQLWCKMILYRLRQNYYSMQCASCSVLPQVPWGRPVTFVGWICATSHVQPKGLLWSLASSFEPSVFRHWSVIWRRMQKLKLQSVHDADHGDVAWNGVFPVLHFHEFQTSAACELYVSWWMQKECWAL